MVPSYKTQIPRNSTKIVNTFFATLHSEFGLIV